MLLQDSNANISPLRDVNNLIMDYLINEGYPSAAEKFAKEANIEQPTDENIQERVRIREAIHRGDLEHAIELIGDVSPEVCLFTISQVSRSQRLDTVSCTTHSLFERF
jgi:hypothetical protein